MLVCRQSTTTAMVELGGIEPPSIRRYLPVIQPFPFRRCRSTTDGSATQLPESRVVFPTGQRSFPLPAFFRAVILRFCCRAAMDWPRAALLLTMSLYRVLGGESELLVGNSVFCPVLRI